MGDTSLKLFENTIFRDEYLDDISTVSLPNKCDLYKIDE